MTNDINPQTAGQLKALIERVEPVEVWLPVLGYEGHYQVSNMGNVKGKRKELLSPVVAAKGYPTVSLSKNGVVKNHKVHVLVLKSFCGDRPFDGAQAAHNDGNAMNAKLSNLRWASAKENQSDIDRHGRRCQGVDVFGAVLDDDRVRDIRARLNSGDRNKPIANDFGVSISTIHLIRHNRIWRHV